MTTISIRSAAVVRPLAAIVLVLLLASLAGQFSRFELGHPTLKGFVPLFDVDDEHNVPAFVSSGLLLCVAGLLAFITALNRRLRRPHVMHWASLSGGFLFMAYDEAFQLHERLIVLGGEQTGLLYFAWLVPGITLAMLVCLLFLRFLWRLDAGTRRRFVVAGAIYMGGLIGVEAVGGWYVERAGFDNWVYTSLATLEEGMEMAGLVVFIRALLKYCAEYYGDVRLEFRA